MSTNKTQNYQLHSWLPEDEFHLTEINENFAALDTALKAEATAAANGRSSLNTALSGQISQLNTTLSGQISQLNAALQSEVTTRAQQIAGKADKTEVAKKADKTEVAKKVEVVTGTYVGSGDTQQINLGFQPKLAITIGVPQYFTDVHHYGFAITGHPLSDYMAIGSTGFTVSSSNTINLDHSGWTYLYAAFR